MSNEYYKGELLSVLETWTTGQLENYIKQLEDRITDTRQQVRELRELKKRMAKYTKTKDTGTRSGP